MLISCHMTPVLVAYSAIHTILMPTWYAAEHKPNYLYLSYTTADKSWYFVLSETWCLKHTNFWCSYPRHDTQYCLLPFADNLMITYEQATFSYIANTQVQF
jgi:hypothetical protein